MRSIIRKTVKARAVAAGLAVLVTAGVAVSEARAQQPAAAPAAQPGTAWYQYVPGRGWVGYAPPSAPAVSSISPGSTASTTPTPAPGWAGYAPGPAWLGYAPASSPRAVVVQPGRRWGILPGDGSRRRAAGLFVNGDNPSLSYTLPAYHEMGTGRPVPLAKPWLPPSP